MSRFADILSRMKNEEPKVKLHKYSNILIIDSTNTFIRSFSVVNSHNLSSNHTGGLLGTLRSISSAIKIIQPTECILVFDGEEGSRNRKYLYPQYKANRLNNNKISNYKSFTDKKEEDNSKYDQMVRLMDYLSLLPVKIVCIDKIEADDVIAYLSRRFYNEYSDSQITIMSTDQDFMQLVNDRTTVWSPTKKKFYKTEDVLELYGTHPNNLPLYKALVGDTSDNVPGVDGFGEKNTPKLIEFLSEETKHTLKDLYNLCENPTKKSVLYDRVLEIKPMVEIFYKIMNLQEPNLSEDNIKEILEYVYIDTPLLKRNEFIRLCNQDVLGESFRNIDSFMESFNTLKLN